ncbi:MAG: SGNH/GDSL hydrolase family protein [Bacteroidales bacterium]|nr:SGNH/GDSL hydrolase family protein [Bacteroidales bacterium]
MKNLICTFGDSIMRGVVSDEKDASGKPIYKISENSFVSRCENRLGVRILNFACFGSTTTHGMKYINRYENMVKDTDIAVFEYGGNDCDFDWKAVASEPQRTHQPKVTLSCFVEQYKALIGRVKEMNIRPIMLSMPLIDPDRFFEFVSFGLNKDNILRWLGGKTMYMYQWHEMYNLELFKMAKHIQVPIIDITTPFLESMHYSDYLCADGIHPNERGHALITEAIADKAQAFLN